jgi:hypothetical protein
MLLDKKSRSVFLNFQFFSTLLKRNHGNKFYVWYSGLNQSLFISYRSGYHIRLTCFFQIIAHNRKPSIYKEQLKAEKLATAKEKKATAAAAKKAMKENKAKILKAIQELGKSPEEILALLSSSNNSNEPQPQENQEEW